MSVASAKSYIEEGRFGKPIVEFAIGDTAVPSEEGRVVFNNVLPVGNWLVCGSVGVIPTDDVNDRFTEVSVIAGNGIVQVGDKYTLAGFNGVEFRGEINIPFSYCFFSDGTNPNDLEVIAIVSNGGTYDIVATPTIQAVRVG